MRLTLRTLLAYLDDILEPTQAKEIGSKIQESSLATSLVNRIREVLRRRRLSAPQVDGADVDANLIAEYLDNTLPPEGVADIEKICLESDVHLAEVAASHQILTLVLGEPVEVAPRSRERMYALLPSYQQAVAAGEVPTVAVAAAPAETVIVPSEKKVEAVQPALPDYLKPRPVWQRVLPYAAVVVVGLVWLGLVISDPDYFPAMRQKPKPDDKQLAQAPLFVPEEKPVKIEPEETLLEPDENTLPAKSNKVTEKPITDVSEKKPLIAQQEKTARREKETSGLKIVSPADLVTEKEMPKEDATDAASVEKAEKEPAEPAKEVATVTETVTKTPPAPPVPADADVQLPPAPLTQYSTGEGVLFRLDTEKKAWTLVPKEAQIQPQDALVVPEDFKATLVVGEAQLPVELLGGTVVQWLPPSSVAPAGLNLKRGRVVFHGSSGSPSIPLAVKIHADQWKIEVLTPDTLCGLEVVLREPRKFEEDFGPVTYAGGIYLATGSVKLTNATGEAQTISGPGFLKLPANQPEEAAEDKEGTSKLPGGNDEALPSWLVKSKPKSPTNFTKIFERQLDNTDPVAVNLELALKNSHPEVSRLAVVCLGLIEDHDAVLLALDRSKHYEARVAAISALRGWINANPQNRNLLKEDLRKSFHEDDADAIYRLVWGYEEEDARDAATSRQLINWLKSDSLAVRELAIYQIGKLTGRRSDFRADGTPRLRNRITTTMQRQLTQDEALLPAGNKTPR